MKKFMKVISAVLAVVMMVSILSVSAFAAEPQAYTNTEESLAIAQARHSAKDDLYLSRNFHNPWRHVVRPINPDKSQVEHHAYVLISLLDKSGELPYGSLIESIVMKASADVVEVRTIRDPEGLYNGYWILVRDHFWSDCGVFDVADYVRAPYVRYAELENLVDYGEDDQQIYLFDLLPIKYSSDAVLIEIEFVIPLETGAELPNLEQVVRPGYTITSTCHASDPYGDGDSLSICIVTEEDDYSTSIDPATYLFPEYAAKAEVRGQGIYG